MSKRLFASLAVTAAIVGTLTVGVQPASAAPGGYERCPDGWYCLFSGPDGTGTMARFTVRSPDLADQYIDNDAESEWNRTGTGALYYTATHFQGENGYSPAGHQGPLGDDWTNIPSSITVG